MQDPLLVNPWGVTATSSSPFWVVNNGTGTTQLLRGDVVRSPFVLNPSPQTVTLPGGPPSLPTGAVAVSNVTTAATDFNFTPTGGSTPVKAVFIFDSITGNIIAWNPALGATAQVVKSQPGHTYTGLAIGNSGGNPFLYAADFANGKIDVFDKTFTPTTLAGTFTDPTIPATFHPF
ncbi:MAG: TIGR03118 family protein, partial [Acidobacteria bacterium]